MARLAVVEAVGIEFVRKVRDGEVDVGFRRGFVARWAGGRGAAGGGGGEAGCAGGGGRVVRCGGMVVVL
jgi:hypothetical protein